MRVQRISEGNVIHDHDSESEDYLSRQILNISVKMKAMEDLCEWPCKMIHKELPCQYLYTWRKYSDCRFYHRRDSATAKVQNGTYIKIIIVTTRRFKKSATFKKEGKLLKSEKCRFNLISRIDFLLGSYKFLTNTHTSTSLLFQFTIPLATSVTVHVIAQKITDNIYVNPQWAMIFEIGSYTF